MESVSLCQRRKNVGEGKENKKSWIDPPEESKTVTLTQAEIESCMQTYEVGLLIETWLHTKSSVSKSTNTCLWKRWCRCSRCLCQAGHAAGLPGDVHSVWLCGALLLCVSLGSHVRANQQHHRDPQRCPEALHWPSEALRPQSGEHRTVAGQCVLSWRVSVRQAYSVGGHQTTFNFSLSLPFSQHQTAMEAMGLIAIIVNCYLIGQCGQLQRLFPWLSPEMTIISIVLLEVCTVLCVANAGLSIRRFVIVRKCSLIP